SALCSLGGCEDSPRRAIAGSPTPLTRNRDLDLYARYMSKKPTCCLQITESDCNSISNYLLLYGTCTDQSDSVTTTREGSSGSALTWKPRFRHMSSIAEFSCSTWP